MIREEDFAKIEKKMIEIAQRKEALQRAPISKADALKFFGDRGQTYKNELIADLEDGHITTYTQGNFTDLCRGPHLLSTAPIKACKVMAVSSAYWRGDEKRPMLTRVYGITFPKKKLLDEYLALLEEAKAAATTARSVRKWNSSCSPNSSVRVCPCGYPRVLPCACVSKTS